MSATAILETNGLSEGPEECQILILSEDFAAYERAAEVCRRMMERFADEMDFDFKCWTFMELADKDCAHSAMKIAGHADIIMLAMHDMELPPILESWLGAFPETRFRTDGALVLVANSMNTPPATVEKLLNRLALLARRLDMDFVPLPLSPAEHTHHALLEDDWLAAAARADSKQRPQFDHWGLNE